ncbi:hypothetical protein WICMUC_000294 [Wickerhamomyces mucosus]|uniref:Coatomer subunit zeta n=1 Tax=Wickerhamomyces mucosus TaxID=1378264 RepID=A0A9P8TIX5_9ASCO|nr:hypothetical protein WICMUC_000294 [Wickerhamomyces mucosus]
MSKNLSLYSIDSFLILDNEGSRLYAKYYSQDEEFKTVKLQKSFESKLFTKTTKQNFEILIFENKLIIYKEIADIIIYIISGLEENEIYLYDLLSSFKDTLNNITNGGIDKKSILENYDKVVITIDELIDNGIILETESSALNQRTSNTPTNETPSLKNIDLSEKGLFNAFNFARGKIAERLQQGL